MRVRTGPPNANIDRYLAFAFGVVFTGVLLYLATVVTNPTPLAIQIYVTVLALAAGGVGALLPGFLEVRYKGLLRAGGAMALFAIVYFNEPAISKNVPNFVPPDSPAQPVITAYLNAVDSGNLDRAWELLSETGRMQVGGDKQKFEELYRNAVLPLGQVESRVQLGEATYQSPPGEPPGLYEVFQYKTKYKNDDGKYRAEAITLRANSDLKWEVFSHLVSMTTI